MRFSLIAYWFLVCVTDGDGGDEEGVGLGRCVARLRRRGSALQGHRG